MAIHTDITIEKNSHIELIRCGITILSTNPNFSVDKIRMFCVKACVDVIKQFDATLIDNEFSEKDLFNYKPFTNTLAESIELGVVKFMIESNLINDYINSPDLKKVIAALNNNMNNIMAEVLKIMKLNRTQGDTTDGIFDLEALGILVNRTLYHINTFL